MANCRLLNVWWLLSKNKDVTCLVRNTLLVRTKTNDSCFKSKKKATVDELKSKYVAAKEACEVQMPPPDIEPRGVFANNELNLAEVKVYGFDYDYTLAVYKESLHYLIYDLGRDWLINKFKYPKEIEKLKYTPGFAIRGLHYDIQNGLLMKIDSFHQIQLGTVYRGLTPLSKEEITKIYKGIYIPQALIRSQSGEEARMKQLNDLFSVPEICLLSNITEYFEKKNIAYHPEILFYDVQNAVRSIHPVMHKMLDETCIDKYLEKQPELIRLLNRLRKAGKKMFLITNSPYEFVDCGMKYMIGPNWREMFELVLVQARKPKFFTDQRRPIRIYDETTKSQLWEKITKLDKGKIYIEGTLKQIQDLTGWYDNSVLYFGDQIYSDLADLTLNYGWRTGAIIYELENEITILNSEDYRHTVSWLLTLQNLLETMQDYEDSEAIIADLLKERDELRMKTKSHFNPQFGSIFRTHHNPTYFSRRLFRYSDVYMSHVTNLLNFSLNHVFYPRRGALPHECKIPYI
ncbi:5'-nucleotidase domain-containing protein 3-like isoform X1 [Centruroides sculpturatus]|uniref:5'-nucleotidase domain-containing protein 3-like isoform X1 n=1 Tax=Centruroides sculpturatus TaxID=218467 RepID=UPI000C6CE2A8|nr:5'-nucleotidase domain-containing protein 3-like isoform X1 [Centruroides sculpturatus]